MKIECIKQGETDMLVICIPVTKAAFSDAQASKSGKTKVLATTHGFASFATPNGLARVSLNVVA